MSNSKCCHETIYKVRIEKKKTSLKFFNAAVGSRGHKIFLIKTDKKKTVSLGLQKNKKSVNFAHT